MFVCLTLTINARRGVVDAVESKHLLLNVICLSNDDHRVQWFAKVDSRQLDEKRRRGTGEEGKRREGEG